MRKPRKLTKLMAVAILVLSACQAWLGVQLVSPPDGALLSCDSPEGGGLVRFSWQPVAGAVNYVLEVYDGSGSLLLTRTTTQAEVELSLPCGANYSWRVVANLGGTSYASGRRQFRISEAPGGGAGPQLVSPPDGATIECQSPDNGEVQFAWTAVQNAAGYVLEVYRATGGSLFRSVEVTETSGRLVVSCRPELELSYRWRVGAKVGGQIRWSSFRSFAMTVEKPFLVSPPNGGTVSVGQAACSVPLGDTVSVTFTWTVVRDATGYRVDVFGPTGALVGSTVVQGATTTSAAVTWTEFAACPVLYTWRVTAIKAAPNPPVVSDTWSFTTVP